MSGLGKIGSAIYHAPHALGKLFGVKVTPVTSASNLMRKMVGMFFSYQEKQADTPLEETSNEPHDAKSILTQDPNDQTPEDNSTLKELLLLPDNLDKSPSSPSLAVVPTPKETTAAKEILKTEVKELPPNASPDQRLTFNAEIYKKIIEQRVNTLTDYQKLLRETDESLDQSDQETLDSLKLILKSLQNNSSRESENVTDAPSTSEQPVNQSNTTQEITADITQEITADIKDQTSQDNTQINDLWNLLQESTELKKLKKSVQINMEKANAHENEKARKNLPKEAAIKGAELLEKQENKEKTNKPLREAEAKKKQADLAAKVKLKSEIEAANTRVKETHGALNDLYYSIAGKTGAWDTESKNTLQPFKEKIVKEKIVNEEGEEGPVNLLKPQTPSELQKAKESLQELLNEAITLNKKQESKTKDNFSFVTNFLNKPEESKSDKEFAKFTKQLNEIPDIETPKA
jgi:hypothetical protein